MIAGASRAVMTPPGTIICKWQRQMGRTRWDRRLRSWQFARESTSRPGLRLSDAAALDNQRAHEVSDSRERTRVLATYRCPTLGSPASPSALSRSRQLRMPLPLRNQELCAEAPWLLPSGLQEAPQTEFTCFRQADTGRIPQLRHTTNPIGSWVNRMRMKHGRDVKGPLPMLVVQRHIGVINR